MSLEPVHSRSLGDQIFGQLVGEILNGQYPAGSQLPAERALVDVFKVNRHVVREALKRLEQMGLVKVSHGGGTRVLDYTRHAGLDLLALMADGARGGHDVLKHWLSVMEMRAAIAADIARLCALRGSRAIKDDLLAISAEMSRADPEQLFVLEVRFWDRVHEGADNIAYRLAFNSMLKGSNAVPDNAKKWSAHECKQSGYRQGTANAIARGDAAEAEACTRRDMRTAVEAFAKLVDASRAASSSATTTAAAEATSTASAASSAPKTAESGKPRKAGGTRSTKR